MLQAQDATAGSWAVVLENWDAGPPCHIVFSKPTGQQIRWNPNVKEVYAALFSCIIDALSSSVFRAVTIHSCTCDRTASWFHYAQLGGNAYFNLPRGEVTLCSAALANQPFNHLGGWRFPHQDVIRLPAASLFSFCCQHISRVPEYKQLKATPSFSEPLRCSPAPSAPPPSWCRVYAADNAFPSLLSWPGRPGSSAWKPAHGLSAWALLFLPPGQG